jgi:hypothetical protein
MKKTTAIKMPNTEDSTIRFLGYNSVSPEITFESVSNASPRW